MRIINFIVYFVLFVVGWMAGIALMVAGVIGKSMIFTPAILFMVGYWYFLRWRSSRQELPQKLRN